ncbi:hypothetical protein SAY87_020778 [Trapa incisa]|uniref:Uncharacterized protein n=1 Tax=Trapa incisa TaxID=236973 RepID=A0AAN7JQA6_9MYRT|nr:hypothetical protein SAY87_020778 [Trapa incisa]
MDRCRPNNGELQVAEGKERPETSPPFYDKVAAMKRGTTVERADKNRIPPARGGVKRRIFALLYKHTLRHLTVFKAPSLLFLGAGSCT